jgi:hypothetical protein
LANQPAGLADELRKRGEALDKAGKALTDISAPIIHSGLSAVDEIFGMTTGIETLGNGFKGLTNLRCHSRANAGGQRRPPAVFCI